MLLLMLHNGLESKREERCKERREDGKKKEKVMAMRYLSISNERATALVAPHPFIFFLSLSLYPPLHYFLLFLISSVSLFYTLVPETLETFPH
jgi:hypothetical protein